MNYSRNVRDKWLLLSTLDFSNPENHRLSQNIYNDRIIDKFPRTSMRYLSADSVVECDNEIINPVEYLNS